MAKLCRLCNQPIHGLRGKNAVYCSSLCRVRSVQSQRPGAIIRRNKEEIKRAEQQADDQLKKHLDMEATLARLSFEGKLGKRPISGQKPRQILLVRPELEKE
jgi:hypothetical protein